jgi:hypothetical protein
MERETEREGGAVGVDDFLVLAPTGEGQVFFIIFNLGPKRRWQAEALFRVEIFSLSPSHQSLDLCIK